MKDKFAFHLNHIYSSYLTHKQLQNSMQLRYSFNIKIGFVTHFQIILQPLN